MTKQLLKYACFLLAYPCIFILAIFKPNDIKRHKVSAYVTILGLFNGWSIKRIAFTLNQIFLESAYCKSNLTESLNNCIGMRCVSIRETTQTGCYNTDNNGQFGTYANLFDCVQDFFLWSTYFNANNQNYKELASQVYCSADKDYVAKIESMPNQEWCVWLIIISLPFSIVIPSLIINKKYRTKLKRKLKKYV